MGQFISVQVGWAHLIGPSQSKALTRIREAVDLVEVLPGQVGRCVAGHSLSQVLVGDLQVGPLAYKK